MSIRSKLSIIPYFVVLSVVYFQFSLQQAYDRKLSRKLETFNTTQLQALVDDKVDRQRVDVVELAAAIEQPEDNELSFEKEESIPYEDDVVREADRISRDGSDSPIAVRFRERRHLLETGCSSMTPLDLVLAWRPKPWFLVSEKPGIVGCAPPRTASKEWIHMFRELDHLPATENTEEEREEVQEFVEHIPANEGDHLLVSTAATRFLVVRHPFARIYSVWKSFFKSGTKEGEELLEKYSIRRYIRTQEGVPRYAHD